MLECHGWNIVITWNSLSSHAHIAFYRLMILREKGRKKEKERKKKQLRRPTNSIRCAYLCVYFQLNENCESEKNYGMSQKILFFFSLFTLLLILASYALVNIKSGVQMPQYVMCIPLVFYCFENFHTSVSVWKTPSNNF